MIKDYNPTNVKETELVDQHGNKGYNIFFEGEDKPVFMMAKNAPLVGNVEYGEIVDTPKKSGQGTYRKFARKQRDEAFAAPVGPRITTKESSDPLSISAWERHSSIERQSALKSAAGSGLIDTTEILKRADSFLDWLRGNAYLAPSQEGDIAHKQGSLEAPTDPPTQQVPEEPDTEEEIDLDDILF